MSIRWRLDGSLICAKVSDEQDGDSYIDDKLHYQLSVVSRAIVADIDHEENGLWYWVHSDDFLRGKKEC